MFWPIRNTGMTAHIDDTQPTAPVAFREGLHFIFLRSGGLYPLNHRWPVWEILDENTPADSHIEDNDLQVFTFRSVK